MFHKKHAIHHSHPGFHEAAKGIAARQGIPMGRAQAILASATRHASAHAKHENPRLKNVMMSKMMSKHHKGY